MPTLNPFSGNHWRAEVGRRLWRSKQGQLGQVPQDGGQWGFEYLKVETTTSPGNPTSGLNHPYSKRALSVFKELLKSATQAPMLCHHPGEVTWAIVLCQWQWHLWQWPLPVHQNYSPSTARAVCNPGPVLLCAVNENKWLPETSNAFWQYFRPVVVQQSYKGLQTIQSSQILSTGGPLSNDQSFNPSLFPKNIAGAGLLLQQGLKQYKSNVVKAR